MDEFTRRRLARKQARYRTLGTSNPVCPLCGKDWWWVRWEYHHTAGRAFASDLIFICGDCHDEASEKQKDHELVNDNHDPETKRHIKMLLGQADLMEIAARHMRTAAKHINGWPKTPAQKKDSSR